MTKNVYVSLTTISQRINIVYETIISILSQDYPIREVSLYISYEPFIIDRGIKIIPKKLEILTQADSRFKIKYVENMGSYRKLIPMLKEHWKEDCLIVTVDDDKIYDHSMIKKMVDKYHDTGEKYIISNRAFVKMNNILRNLCETTCQVDSEVCDLIKDEITNKGNAQTIAYILGEQYDFINLVTFFEGNDGILYHPKFFTPLVYDFTLIEQLAATHDDFWFKLCALINGYGVTCVNAFQDRPAQQIENTRQSSLSVNINKGSYDKFLNKLVRWFHQHGLLETGFRKAII